ncbi:MAG: hypothetical protein ABEJ46_03145, partial [Gemmatimonadota bacterium]
FPEQLDRGARPWAPRKLYRRAWRDPDRATLRVATGDYDPLLGRSPFQLAMEGRSQHRSQGFGTVQPPGPRYTRLLLLEDRTGSPPDAPLFAGVDTSLASVVDGLPPGARREAVKRVDALTRAAAAARDSLRVLDAGAAVPPIRRALRAARSVERLAASAGAEEVRSVFARQAGLARRALLAASGISVRFRAEDDLWVPGSTVRVHAELWNGSGAGIRADAPDLALPAGWDARLLPADSVRPSPAERSRFYGSPAALEGGPSRLDLPAGRLARWTFRVRVPRDARPTEQYFLRRDTTGALYRWPDEPGLWGRPFSPPVVEGRLRVRLDPEEADAEGVVANLRAEVRYRGVDEARGEFWRPVYVVPRLSVATEPEVLVSPRRGGSGPGAAAVRESVTVTVRSQVEDTVRSELALRLPEGWSATPRRARLRIAGRGSSETRSFVLRRTGGGGGDGADEGVAGSGESTRATYRVSAVARPVPAEAAGSGAERSWRRELSVIDYPHIDPVPLYGDAELRIERFPVDVDRGRRVGYVMGTGDAGPAAIRQLGLPVTMIGP